MNSEDFFGTKVLFDKKGSEMMLAPPGAPLTSVSVAPACGSRHQAATAEGSPAYASQAPAAGTAGLRRELSGACSLSDNSGQCSGREAPTGAERQQQAMLVLQQHQVPFSLLLGAPLPPLRDRPRALTQLGAGG